MSNALNEQRIKQLSDHFRKSKATTLDLDLNVTAILCEPYALVIKVTKPHSLHLEIQEAKSLPRRWLSHPTTESLLHTQRQLDFIPRILRFKEAWLQVCHHAPNNFRLVATLAQVFAILIPETDEAP